MPRPSPPAPGDPSRVARNPAAVARSARSGTARARASGALWRSHASRSSPPCPRNPPKGHSPTPRCASAVTTCAQRSPSGKASVAASPDHPPYPARVRRSRPQAPPRPLAGPPRSLPEPAGNGPSARKGLDPQPPEAETFHPTVRPGWAEAGLIRGSRLQGTLKSHSATHEHRTALVANGSQAG